jgi:hypothetical protein
MRQPVDDDRTINLKQTLSRQKSTRVTLRIVAVIAVLLVLVTGGGWLLWRPNTPSPEASPRIAARPAAPPDTAANSEAPPSPPTPNAEMAAVSPAAMAPASPAVREAAPQAVPRDFHIETASEQHMLDNVESETSHGITVFRFKANPRILVMDFASLREQGRMLNRAAALVEKSGLPHDRLLSDAELDAAVHAAGDTVETFYYGHDYAAPSLVRFFSLADREKIPLTSEEEALRLLLRHDGWFAPNARAGLITIPQVGADENVTRLARATILHHELSHGEYFTNPAYAAFVHRFWKQTLTDAERQQIRAHLRSLGYDSALDDLMENEAQAYLMFTDDAEFFTPDMVGMSKGRLAELRNGFYRSMPAGWLRDSLGQTLGVNQTSGTNQTSGANKTATPPP